MGGRGSGLPKAELLRLDGTQIDKDGNVTKTDFFKFLKLPLDRIANLEKTMTPEQALKFRNHIVSMRVGTSAAMPMLCGGDVCINKTCPFRDEQYVIGEPCPFETFQVADWTNSYVEELGIDPNNRVKMILVNKLVECDMIDYRANLYLSSNEEAATLLRTNTTEFDNATTSENMDIHPILKAKADAHKQRKEILEMLVATPKEQYKKAAALKKQDGETIGKYLAEQKSKFSKLRKKTLSVEDADLE